MIGGATIRGLEDSNYRTDSDSDSSCGSLQEAPENIDERMYALALDPIRIDLSEHTSDDEPIEVNDFDTDSECEAEAQHAVQEHQCFCSSCGDMLDDGAYCCSKIDVAVKLTEEESVNCITQIQRFKASICDESVLELLAYSVNRKEFPEKKDVEKRHKLFRFAAYRTFFGILELNGLGKGWRYKLPTCVVTKIRNLYPSKSGKYIGFQSLNKEVCEKLNIF